ncbi:MAG TPA: SDR family NAD(P)-dependent oxidoreductase, partial [Burkholderiales bacterium]|nr:SDR family NAD(P)-dependent oxidoreductase [Burkholderiales bacterium]
MKVDLESLTETLETLGSDWALLDRLPAEERARLLKAVAALHNPDRVARRQRLKEARRERKAAEIRREEEVLHGTGIRTLRRKPVFTTPNVFPPQPAAEPRPSAGRRHCYVCKAKYEELHHFYDQLCPPCAALNFAKRTELADLRGRVALLTGGRVKIGYQAGLKLLRCGAELIVTTRFPRDSAKRYAAEPDFSQWGHRLQIFGLDLRHTPSVEAFCRQMLDSRERLDFIVNNACQTVRRPPEFYTHMMEGEKASLSVTQVKLVAEVPSAPELSQVRLLPEEYLESKGLFPQGVLDQD